jgi:hypothetical protein
VTERVAQRSSWVRHFITVLGPCAILACGSDATSPTNPTKSQPTQHEHQDAAVVEDPADAAAAEAGAAAAFDPNKPAFCARAGDDAVRDIFCADNPVTIGSLEDFQNLFEVNPRGRDPNDPPDEFAEALYLSPINGDVAVIGHSTALPGHIISPINPRWIAMGSKIILAYQRGVQRVELASRARNTFAFNFYLLSFDQACNDRETGCNPGDLYTDKVERDWNHVQIRESEDLKNTPLDCKQCHQRARDMPTLLMRELKSPWTHFLFPVEATDSLPGIGGNDLMQDYLDAKDGDRYGGLLVEEISPLSAFRLQTFVGNDQPLLFDAPKIANERWPYGPDGYSKTAQPSPTWNAGYEAFKRGEQLALPYIEQRAVDLDKQAALSKAYQKYLAGEIEADALPDLADIFPDDPHLRAQIGLQIEPDATPEDALIQACAGCHNDVLDQSISRARFTVALSRLDRAELDLAIDRVERPRDAPGAMPPPEFRQLDDAGRARLLEYLKQDLSSIEIDPRLEQAAQHGMSGGGGGCDLCPGHASAQ